LQTKLEIKAIILSRPCHGEILQKEKSPNPILQKKISQKSCLIYH